MCVLCFCPERAGSRVWQISIKDRHKCRKNSPLYWLSLGEQPRLIIQRNLSFLVHRNVRVTPRTSAHTRTGAVSLWRNTGLTTSSHLCCCSFSPFYTLHWFYYVLRCSRFLIQVSLRVERKKQRGRVRERKRETAKIGWAVSDLSSSSIIFCL